MSKPGTRERYEARMKSGSRKDLQLEFEEWIADLRYEALTPAFKAYLFEAFVGGWGAKVRRLKRRRRK